MLCDNCTAHTDDVQLTNVKLVFLPPNTTSLIQPTDQGIIANFKKQYRWWNVVSDIDIQTLSAGTAAGLVRKLTVLDSLHMQREGAESRSQQLSTVIQKPVLCCQLPDNDSPFSDGQDQDKSS